MTVLYADTSALARAFLSDEKDHEELKAMLLEGASPVASSEITRVEMAGALRGAAGRGRVRQWRLLLDSFDAHCRPRGPIVLVDLAPQTVLPAARELVLAHRVRTLDALHLVVARDDVPRLVDGDDIVFVTRDDRQAAAARAIGLTTR